VVEESGCGRVVGPRDPEALAEAIDALLGDAPQREDCAARSLALAEKYRWSKVLQPLVEFCRHAEPAADRRPGLVTPAL
jgi:glycosyltransferase involved in cell wall biosynthesis